MEKDYRYDGGNDFCIKLGVEDKKIRLFGFEVDPFMKDRKSLRGAEGGDENLKFSNTVLSQNEKLVKVKSPASDLEGKKCRCQFCFKEFANSQALGGHQNAHKKERLKKKRLLRERSMGSNGYLQPVKSSHGFSYSFASHPWFYKQSLYVPEFSLFEETQKGFNLVRNPDPNKSLVSILDSAPSSFTVQQNTCKTSFVHIDTSCDHGPIVIKSSPLLIPKQSCKSLDLHLGLTMQ